jgi:signal transduction histidine kinase
VRVRITALAVVIVGLGLGIGSWALVERVQARLEDQVIDEGREQVEYVAAQLEAGVEPGSAVAGLSSASMVQVLTVEGQIVAGTEAVADPEQQAQMEENARTFSACMREHGIDYPLPILDDGSVGTDMPADFDFDNPAYAEARVTCEAEIVPIGLTPPTDRVDSQAVLVSAQPISDPVASPFGYFTVVALPSLEEVRRSVTALSQALWVAIPLSVLVVGGLAWFLTGRALRPVERMRTEVDEITHTTLHRRVPDPGTADEVGRLARTMNAMLDRLERAQEQQRRFVSDASHELRSPLTTIKASVEIAARHPVESRWQQAATTVLSETDRLDGLVGDLLELARLDEATSLAPAAIDIDLDELVRAEVARHRGDTTIAIDTSALSAARIRGDHSQITRVVRNLIDNAHRHSRERVEISLHSDGGEAVLRVDDDGAGIPEGDRERVFERFTRLDEGRARSAGGAGLGLALVKAVVTAHRGTVVVADAPAGGARFEVRLPRETGI